MARLLKLFPEIRRGDLERTGYFVIHAVESLTHRVAAHPDEQMIDKSGFVEELVTMLQAYLRCSLDERGPPS